MSLEPLDLGFEQLERGADAEIKIAGGLEELLAIGEGMAAVAGDAAAPAKNMRARSRSCWVSGGNAARRRPCRAAARRCRGPALQSGCCESERPK